MSDLSPSARPVHRLDVLPGDVVLEIGPALVRTVSKAETNVIGATVLTFTDGETSAYGTDGHVPVIGHTPTATGHTYRATVDAHGVTVRDADLAGFVPVVHGGNWEDDLNAVTRPDGTLMTLSNVDAYLARNGWQRTEKWRVQVTDEGTHYGHGHESFSLVATVIPA